MVTPKPSAAARLCAAREIFDRQMKKAAACRKRLQDWDDASDYSSTEHPKTMIPLREKILELEYQMALRLDEIWWRFRLTRWEKRQLSEYIRPLVHDLLDDDVIIVGLDVCKDLYDRHCRYEDDVEEVASQDEAAIDQQSASPVEGNFVDHPAEPPMEWYLQGEGGCEHDALSLADLCARCGDDDGEQTISQGIEMTSQSASAVKAAVNHSVKVRIVEPWQPDENWRERAARAKPGKRGRRKRGRRKQSHRKQKKSRWRVIDDCCRKTPEQRALSRSIRKLYADLTAAMQRGSGADPHQQARKIAMKPRVTRAYKHEDLVQLLELCLELEDIDPRCIPAMCESQLEYYSRMLEIQRMELEQDLDRIRDAYEAPYIDATGYPPYTPISPETLMGDSVREVSGARAAIARLEKDLILLADDTSAKLWLKRRMQWPKHYNEDVISDEIPF